MADLEGLLADPDFKALPKPIQDAVAMKILQQTAPVGKDLAGGMGPLQALTSFLRGEQRAPFGAKSAETRQFEAAHPTTEPLPPGFVEGLPTNKLLPLALSMTPLGPLGGIPLAELMRQFAIDHPERTPQPGDIPLVTPLVQNAVDTAKAPGVLPGMAMGGVLQALPGTVGPVVRTLAGAPAATAGEVARRGMTGESLDLRELGADLLTNVTLQGSMEALGQSAKSLFNASPPVQLLKGTQQKQALQTQIETEQTTRAGTTQTLQGQIDRAQGQTLQQAATYEQEMTRLLGEETQQAASLQQSLKAYGQGTKADLAHASQAASTIKQDYGMLRASLEKLNDNAKRSIALEQTKLGQAKAGQAVDTRTWLKTLDVPTEKEITALYKDVDAFNGERLAPEVMAGLRKVEAQALAKQQRIAAIDPAAADLTPTLPPSSSVPPTFQGARELLTHYGEEIGRLRQAVAHGTATKSEVSAATAKYAALQQGLDDAIESGTLPAEAKNRLRLANEAFKVKATSDELARFLQDAMRTPSGGAEVFEPGKILTRLKDPDWAWLVDKLKAVDLYDGLVARLGEYQRALAAPKDAMLKARELQQTVRQMKGRLSEDEKAFLVRYGAQESATRDHLLAAHETTADELAGLRQETEAGVGMRKEAQARVKQEGEAQTGMLKSELATATGASQEREAALKTQLGAVQTPGAGMGALFSYGAFGVPAVVGTLLGHHVLGGEVGLFAHLLARGLMTPSGQKYLGHVLDATGGINTPALTVALYQMLKPTPVAQATEDHIKALGKGKP
jgi:hypothetical protein